MRVSRFRAVRPLLLLVAAITALALAGPAFAETPPHGAPDGSPASPGSPASEWAAMWHGPPRLGVQVQPMTRELRAFFGGPAERGVLVVRVLADSPAADAGLSVGDVLLSVDGEDLDDPRDLRRRTATAPPRARIDLEILREGEVSEETLRLRGEPNPIFGARSLHELHDALPPGFHQGEAALRRQLSEIERRLRTLERQLGER